VSSGAPYGGADKTLVQGRESIPAKITASLGEAKSTASAGQMDMGALAERPGPIPWWKKLIGLLDRHDGALNAVFGGLVAAFTGALVIVGDRQHKAAMAAIGVARDEFNATHRPRIIVRDVHYGAGDEEACIYLHIVNVGDAFGRIVELKAEAKIVTDGQFAPNIDSEEIDLGRGLGPGEQHKFAADVSLPERMMMLPARAYRDIAVTGSVHLVGNIVYVDGSGRRRRTRFQRKHVRDEDVFMELGNPNYEYAD
jgi:hypothetical protein